MPRKVIRPDDKLPWGRAIDYTSPTGKKTTLYNIAAAAQAVGRTSQTVRKWEISKKIPPSPFKDKQGRRLYSKEHIDALVRCVEKYHISIGVTISPEFSRAIYREFKRINDYFFKEDTTNGTEKES